MYHRPHFGRCHRTNHGRFQAYRDDIVIGVCIFGFYAEVPR